MGNISCDFEVDVEEYYANETPVFIRSRTTNLTGDGEDLPLRGPAELWLRCDAVQENIDWAFVNRVTFEDCDWWYSTKLGDSNEDNIGANNIMSQNLENRRFSVLSHFKKSEKVDIGTLGPRETLLRGAKERAAKNSVLASGAKHTRS